MADLQPAFDEDAVGQPWLRTHDGHDLGDPEWQSQAGRNSAKSVELSYCRELIVELARWSRVAERNGDLHARTASLLALIDLRLGRESSAAADAVGELQGRQPAQDAVARLRRYGPSARRSPG